MFVYSLSDNGMTGWLFFVCLFLLSGRTHRWVGSHGAVSPPSPPPPHFSVLPCLPLAEPHPWRRVRQEPSAYCGCGASSPAAPALRRGVEHAHGKLWEAARRPAGPGGLWHCGESKAALPGRGDWMIQVDHSTTSVTLHCWRIKFRTRHKPFFSIPDIKTEETFPVVCQLGFRWTQDTRRTGPRMVHESFPGKFGWFLRIFPWYHGVVALCLKCMCMHWTEMTVQSEASKKLLKHQT